MKGESELILVGKERISQKSKCLSPRLDRDWNCSWTPGDLKSEDSGHGVAAVSPSSPGQTFQGLELLPGPWGPEIGGALGMGWRPCPPPVLGRPSWALTALSCLRDLSSMSRNSSKTTPFPKLYPQIRLVKLFSSKSASPRLHLYNSYTMSDVYMLITKCFYSKIKFIY